MWGVAYKTGTGGTVGSVYGVRAGGGNTGTGTVTNAYGLYVNAINQTGTVTNPYALYTAGPDKTSFGGDVELRNGVATQVLNTSSTAATVVGIDGNIRPATTVAGSDYIGVRGV